VRDDGGYALSEDVRTLAEQMRSRGFTTGAAVSSFLLRPASGTAQGFSFFDADMPLTEATETPAAERNGLETYARAEQWMRMQTGQRYFLFVEVDNVTADTVVSRLVQLLNEMKLYSDATIILTAARGDPNAAGWLDDRSLAIPLIVKQPDGEGAGRNVATPVQQIDLVPTLLDLIRAPIPGGLRGRSLRPLLDSEEGTIPEQSIYAESFEAVWRFGGLPVYALTEDGYRLTRAATDILSRVDDSVPREPSERDRAKTLSAKLDRLLAGRPVPAPVEVAPADAAAYAAAGYLPGLRIVQPPSPPPDQAEQTALAEAHRAAVRLVSTRRYADAIGALRNMARTRPDLATLQFQLGSLLLKAGRLTDAVTAFRAAAALRPDDPEIVTAMARTNLRARQLGEAKTRAAEAIALAEKAAVPPIIADAHEIAARVALAEPDVEAATTHAELAQKADPTRPLVTFVQGRIAYDEGRYEDALAAFQGVTKTLREQNRELGELHLYLGDTLARLDRYAEAETEFKEELRAFPEQLQAYSSLTALYRASNRDAAVQQTIEELVQAAPTPEGYAMAARLWTVVGDRTKADALRADARHRFRGDPLLTNSNGR
jgi:tetratricopeptide (TPR) repeat protein